MKDQTPAIAILPYGHTPGANLRRFPADDLHWPLGQPDRMRGQMAGDLLPDDHLPQDAGAPSARFWHPRACVYDGGGTQGHTCQAFVVVTLFPSAVFPCVGV